MPLDQYSDAVLSQMPPKPVERVSIQQMRQQMGSKCAGPQAQMDVPVLESSMNWLCDVHYID